MPQRYDNVAESPVNSEL